MSELGELLELLHGARHRYRTARGVLRLWTDLRLSERAHERFEQELRAAGASTGRAYALFVGEGAPAAPPERHEMVVRFWSEGPSRFREETETLAPARHEHVTVLDGTRWWTYSPEWGVVSNVGTGGDVDETHHVGGGELWGALLDPSVWLPAFDFEPAGEREWTDRSAVGVRARPRQLKRSDPYLFRHQIAAGGDAYEFLVDREHGIVLRASASLEDEEFWLIALEEIAFDEQFPPQTFAFEPPPGEQVRGPDVRVAEQLTIEEAARRVSFPLFVVPELPEGRWQMDVIYTQPRERPPVKESVSIAYHRADATHQLMLTERPAGDGEPEWVAYRPPGLEVDRIEREGRTFTVYRPERRHHGIPLTVVCEREGTAFELSSSDLDEETLLGLAASLERFE